MQEQKLLDFAIFDQNCKIKSLFHLWKVYSAKIDSWVIFENQEVKQQGFCD